jgi:hypothetical protein
LDHEINAMGSNKKGKQPVAATASPSDLSPVSQLTPTAEAPSNGATTPSTAVHPKNTVLIARNKYVVTEARSKIPIRCQIHGAQS